MDFKATVKEMFLNALQEKKLDPVGKADADIDNDGDVDSSDEYLHKRRKAIKKAMTDEELSAKQKKIDLNKNGKVDGHDLAMLRAKKKK